MIAIIPLLLAGLSATAAALVGRMVDAPAARDRSTRLSGGALLLAGAATMCAPLLPANGLAAWGLPGARLLPEGLLVSVPLVNATIAWLAFALAPTRTHPPRVQASMWALLSMSFAFVAWPHPLVLAAVWAGSILLTGRALRRLPAGGERLFNVYLVPSVITFAIGAYLVAVGKPATAAPFVLGAIAIREGTIPVHGWLPRMVETAPLGLVVAFAGPQLGVFAQLELLAALDLGTVAHGIAAMGAITAVLAAAMALAQCSARRALAFLIMSQTGLVAFGLESHSPVGRTGALLTWQVLALSTSGFVMTLAALEARRGKPLLLTHPQGHFARTPRLALSFLLFGFASVGFPVTLGFVAEDLLVQGTVDEFPVLGLGLVLATALNGMTVMRAFFMLFTGSRFHQGERDLTPRERWAVTVIGAGILLTGMVPAPIVGLDGPATKACVMDCEHTADADALDRKHHRAGHSDRRASGGCARTPAFALPAISARPSVAALRWPRAAAPRLRDRQWARRSPRADFRQGGSQIASARGPAVCTTTTESSATWR